ncbi:ArnT family glycosyltransferase [Falsiroseomonas sp. HW251]|uniref:ArnT family glycosyltransferase n=1 Tax=Falsiroseomonas sp. HW251 TaxID=3390998 RepID=UPI003D31E464
MPEAPTPTVTIRHRTPPWRDVVAMLVLVAMVVVLRITSFVPAVVDTDEGLYMVQAREWLSGGWPLVAAWDMHPVGAPAMFALAFLAFGVSVEAARLLGMICVAATACALYGTARAVRAPWAIGVAAGVIYAAQSVLLGGLCTNTELLIAPFVTGAMAIGMRGAARAMARDGTAPGMGSVIAMGLLIGWALVVKQVVVPEGCLAFALLALPALMKRLLPFRRALAMALVYALLCATPFVLMGAAYWVRGWLPEYLDGSLLAPFRYSMERIETEEAARRIASAMLMLLPGFLMAAIALLSWRPRAAAQPAALLTAFVLLWFVVASAAIAGPGFYFAHYFLLWLPPLSLLAAIGAWRVANAVSRPGATRMVFAGLVALVALDAWSIEMRDRVERGPGWLHRDPVREVAALVAQVAGPGGVAFMANYHPAVYVLSNTRAPTRFVFPAHLTGDFEDLSTTSTEAELGRVLAERPKAIAIDREWMRNMRRAAAAQVDAALEKDYELYATVQGNDTRVEIWKLREG